MKQHEEKIECELHLINIYLRDIAKSLRKIASSSNTPIRDTNTREELSDDDLK